MQKDDRYYTILSTSPICSKFINQPVKVSKKSLHTCAAFIFLSAIVFTGVFGFTQFDISYFAKANAQNQSQAASKPVKFARTSSSTEVKAYNYDRPDSANISKHKIGGPDDPFHLTDTDAEPNDNNMEAQLRTIETTSNPQFLPSMWAHLGKVNNEFGYRRNPFGGRSYEFHSGMDIDGEQGDGVIAPAKGMVVKAGWQGGYGNLIEIDHGNGLTTRYGHLSRIGAQVGDMVERGQLIGLIGSTGRSTGPHLHFEIRLGARAINPRRFLPPSIPN
jgi:murein DD-endopeptidase MepM/ murein hydrolase activator NlpD